MRNHHGRAKNVGNHNVSNAVLAVIKRKGNVANAGEEASCVPTKPLKEIPTAAAAINNS
jgi:hypothetical protein